MNPEDAMTMLRKLFYTGFYYRRPPWDTRISPPELLAFIASHPPGQALDLGCGGGTNAITLAQHGWQVVGVDFVGRAIRIARRRAKEAGVEVSFFKGDVTRLDTVQGPFDLALDIGCFHSLTPRGMVRYARNLERLLAPGGTFLMYAFYQDERSGGQKGSLAAGITHQDLMLFEGRLTLQDRQDGLDRGSRPSSWFTYTR